MTALDDSVPLNPDVFIDHAYRAQVDLKLLIESVARQPDSPLSEDLLLAFIRLHRRLALLSPSSTRH